MLYLLGYEHIGILVLESQLLRWEVILSKAEARSLINFEGVGVDVLYGAMLGWTATVRHLERLVKVLLLLNVYYSIQVLAL